VGVHRRHRDRQRLEAYVTTSDASVRALEQALGTDAVRTDLNTLDLFSTDLHASGPRPIGVVRPRSADGVAQAVAAAISHGCTVVPRGGGLSYTAGYRCTAEPCVLFDLSGLDTIESISEEDMIVVAEIGVTWKQLYAELAPRRLRLPFFGTFSGAGATVGGGLSQGAVFFGSARYGSAADIVLGLEVATAEHGLVRTGQWALPNSTKPVFRNFGPDLTGLFLHDGGALGIKTRAVLKLIREPDETGYASFSLPSLEDAASALSAVARTDACEDLYVLDPQAVATAADQRGGFRGAIGAVRAVAGKADGPLGRSQTSPAAAVAAVPQRASPCTASPPLAPVGLWRQTSNSSTAPCEEWAGGASRLRCPASYVPTLSPISTAFLATAGDAGSR
jgi:FAD/FMN-containing dehydrogenase